MDARPRAFRAFGRQLKAFRASRRGATAVEFAMVALPFLFCVFAIFELAIVFLISVTLDNATAAAARKIRTGDTVASGGGYAQSGTFAQQVCDGMGWLGQSQCTPNQNLFVDVRVLNGFGDNSAPPPVLNSAVNTANFCYYSGSPGNIVLVRAFFKWPLLTPFLNSGLSRLGNGVALISSTSAFKTEPYPGAQSSGATTC